MRVERPLAVWRILAAVVSTLAFQAGVALPVNSLAGLKPGERAELGQVLQQTRVVVPAGVELIVTSQSRLTLRKGAVVDLSAATVIAEPGTRWIDAGGGLVPQFETTLAAAAAAGARAVSLKTAQGIPVGANLSLDLGNGAMHATIVTSVDAGGTVGMLHPLARPVAAGRAVTAGVHRYEPNDPAHSLDGGRLIFNPSQAVSAGWYLGGARDFGLAVTIAAHGMRAQSRPDGSYSMPTLLLHGRHTATVPADLTALGDDAGQKLVQCDAVITWAPTPENAPFPFLDLTDTRAIRFTGRLVVIGDARSVPQRGVQFARSTLPSHSGLHDVSAIELDGQFSVAGWIFSQAENNFGNGNSIRNAAPNGVAISLSRDPDPAYPQAPRSKYRALNRELVSFNFARSWNDLMVFAQGDDTYREGVPASAAIVLEGVTRATLDNVYVASNIPVLLLRANHEIGTMASIRITDLQQHGRPNFGSGDPAAAVVIHLPDERDRIDGLMLSMSRASATQETIRIVGDGTLNDPTIHLRASTGNIRATGRCRLLGADIEVENPRAQVNLASCRQVSGVIRTPNPQGVLLPAGTDPRQVRVEDTRP